MDALQAYICAVQLDKSHTAAWTNLGESLGPTEVSLLRTILLWYICVWEVVQGTSHSSLIQTTCCCVLACFTLVCLLLESQPGDHLCWQTIFVVLLSFSRHVLQWDLEKQTSTIFFPLHNCSPVLYIYKGWWRSILKFRTGNWSTICYILIFSILSLLCKSY
jgi:hypothetical protein